MNNYVATFHSHIGAVMYFKALKKQGITAKLMPVPRKVSSSCGTGVWYMHIAAIDFSGCELECVYIESNGAYECVIRK